VLQKLSATNYDTGWATPAADYITAVTAPLAVTSGNLSVNLSTYLPLAGGTMDANATVELSDTVTGTVSEVGGYGFAVSSASNINLKTNVLFDRVLVAGAVSATTIKPTGVEFPDLTLQTSAGISAATASATYQTLAGMSSYLTTSAAASTYYLQTNPSGFITSSALTPYLLSSTAASTYQTLAGMSSYLTTATAATTYAPIAAGLPTGGTVGQVLTKNSGTNFDASFATLIPGDRYLTSSTTSNTISNGNKTFTIGTGLSYTPTQNLTISYDASNHMHGEVLTYNSGTGVLTVDINHHTGSGTYTAWVVNVGGVTPATSVAFADITGAVSSNANLQAALDLKSNLASPTFTGTPLSTTAAADTNTTQISTTAFVIGQASSTTPAATGTAAVGTSLKYARADHVHANPLPPNGTTAQVLSKIDGTSYNVQWVTPSGGGGGGTDYQAYTTPGTYTWTKPAGAKWVEIWLYGAGGGGGSGGRFATSSGRAGGGGGGGGSYVIARVAASALAATQTVVVGAGGLPGPSVTIDNTNGNSNTNGSNTTFSIFTAVGGGFGQGGSTTGGPAGTQRSGWGYLGVGSASGGGGAGTASAGGFGAAIVAGAANAASGGGGGAGAAALSTTGASGGTAGQKTAALVSQSGIQTVIAGGAGGTTGGTLPTTGVAGNGLQGGGTGGGGGAYITGVAGMAGAVGASPGGGGGGGSASDNGFASGAGGAGGPGVAYVITYC
jgi:hypothetical protein